MSRTIALVFTVCALIAVALFVQFGITRPDAVAQDNDQELVAFDDTGKLLRPSGYREWVYVGTPITPNELNGGEAPFPDFHNVYIDPESYAFYEKTGRFRDGTVMVKELVGIGSKVASSGNGYFMGEYIGLEVSIKDEKRFRDDPGHWAYFSFGHEYPLKDAVARSAVASCNGCHAKNAKQDYVFTQYYPVIRAAAPGR